MLSLPLAWLPPIQVGTDPRPLPDPCQEGWHQTVSQGSGVLSSGGGTAPCPLLATTLAPFRVKPSGGRAPQCNPGF